MLISDINIDKDTERKNMSKNIKQILTGLMVIPLMAVGVLGISSTAGATTMTLGDGIGSSKGSDVPEELTGDGGIFTTVVNILLFLIGAVSVIMLIYGGIRYTTSGGNSTAVTSAKNTIMYSVVGLVIAILAYALVNFVVAQLLQAD